MAGKVTNDQVSVKTFNVDDFRKAVNYENPKNKGYVRFVPDGKGGVKLAKVNNKIDLFLSLRTNIDADKNKAIREKFADALTRDLKWADQSKVEKLAESVKLATKGENKGQVRTDALARKEVKAAMLEYDKLVNTTGGRQDMINNLLKSTVERCGGIATPEAVQEMKNRLFPTAEALQEYFSMMDCNADIDVGQPGHMKMDELTFKAKLHALEMKCEQEVRRAEVENLVRNRATMLTAPGAVGNDFGLYLMDADKDQIAGALHYFLAVKGLVPEKEDGGMVGTGGMLFQVFMDDILPKLFEKSVADMRSAGENADRELAMEANFSFDAIMDAAEKFIVGARDYINNPPEDKAKATGDAKLDEIVQGHQKLVDFNLKAAKMRFVMSGLEDVAGKTNIDKDTFKQLSKDAKQAMGAYNAEGLAKTYAQKFLAERGIGEQLEDVNERMQIHTNTTDVIMKSLIKVKQAADIQFGPAKKNEATGKNEAAGQSMGDYIKDMEKAIGEIASGKDGLDKELMGRLFSGTFANMTTRKVALVTSGVGVRPKIEKADEEADKALIQATADAYVAFEKKVGKTLAGAKDAFEKIAKAAKKKGLIDEHAFNDMVQRASAKFANAHKAALQEFFARSPVNSAEDGEKLLSRVLRAKIAEARAELDNDLAVASLGRTLGPANRRTLLDVESRVAEALAQTGLDNVKVGRDGFMDEKTARARLAAGELKRLYTATLAAHLKNIKTVDGHKTLTDKFVADVVKDFNSKAVALMKSVAKSLTAFLAECDKQLKELVKNGLEGEAFGFKGYLTGDYPITEAEKKALIDNLAAETMRYKAPALRSNVEEILDSPKSFEKSSFGSEKDAKAMAKAAIDDYATGGTQFTTRGLVTVISDRKKMVSDFLADAALMREIETSVAATGVFAAGGLLADAAYLEKGYFISKAMSQVKARMNAVPLVYATGDKAALRQRMIKEVSEALKKPVEEWAKFRKPFLAKASAIEQEFSAMGEKKISDVRNWTLSEFANKFLSGDPNAGKMDVALGFLRNQLSENLEFEEGKIKERFNAYVAKIDQVFKPAMDKIRQAAIDYFENTVNMLTPEGAEHLETVLIPKLMKDFEYQIYRDPDLFVAREVTDMRTNEKTDTLTQIIERIKDEVFFPLHDIMEMNSVNSDQALKSLIRRVGAGVILKDKVETDAAIADLKTWLKSDDGHAARVAMEKALLDHYADVGASEYVEGDARAYGANVPGNAVAEFRFAARDVLKNRAVMMLYTAFDNTRIGEVKDAFEKWVDAHGLSQHKDFLRQTTARERIMAKFVERVKSLQENALNGGANEPILTPAFIDVIDKIIDSDAANAMMTEWKEKTMATLQGQYLKEDDELGYMLNPDHRLWKTEGQNLGANVKEAAARNKAEILAVLSAKVSEVAGSLESRGGYDEIKKGIDELTEEKLVEGVKNDVNIVVDECVRRFQIEEASTAMIRNYTHAFERQLIKDAVGEDKAKQFPNGFDDLLADEKVRDNANLMNGIVTARTAIADYLGETLKICREKCVTTTVLENSFRSTANACIDEIKKSKALWKNGLESGIKAIAK